MLNNSFLLFHNITSNRTRENCESETSVDFGIARVILSIPGLVLNMLFIATLLKNKSVREPLILLMFLSFGDFIVAAKVLSVGINDFVTVNHRGYYNFTRLECFYVRPHLSLLIIGSLIQSTGTLLVALERTVAVLFPYFYFTSQKAKYIMVSCILACVFVIITYVSGIIVVAAGYGNSGVFHGLCYPSLVVSPTYGGFLFLYPSVVGCIAIGCYFVIFGFIFYDKFLRSETKNHKYEIDQRRNQMWLLKISSILAFNAFAFIVVPYIILYLGTNIKCPTSVLYFMRQYVSFLHAINSFSGLTISIISSPQLRTAVKTTLGCGKNKVRSMSNTTHLERLSTTNF